jgi:glycosyltransferase involved in cell wall biosynthesis
VDRDRFSPVSADRQAAARDALGVGPDTRVLLTVGRVSRRKGAATVARTARVLARGGERCRWIVVGDGPAREGLADAPLVESVGRVAHNRMADYYHAADLLVHPSLIEGLPNVLLEAAACGTPSLARDVGDCAVAASRTFDKDADPTRIASLASAEYDPASLGPRFDPAKLRAAYADALVAAAGGAD